MIRLEYEITKKQLLEREELKKFYNTPIGVQELCDIVRLGGLLSKINVGDDKAVVAHNFAVEKLERIGLLDEEGLEDLIRWMLKREPDKLPRDIEEKKDAYRSDGRSHESGT